VRNWALELEERLGFERAAVALARKLAVIMHAMLKNGELFHPNAGAATAAARLPRPCGAGADARGEGRTHLVVMTPSFSCSNR